MEIVMEEVGELIFSDCLISTASIPFGNDFAWADWTSAFAVGQISGEDDFHDLKDTMSWDSVAVDLEYLTAGSSPETYDYCSSNVCESTNSSNAGTPALEPPESASSGQDDKWVRAIHLLTAAAEALSGEPKNEVLARVILARLNELLSPAKSCGDSAGGMERLALHFANALSRLVLAGEGEEWQSGGFRHPSAVDMLTASQLLQDLSPSVKFGHFTANQAILEAVAGERRVHIVDFDIMEGSQWAPLFQAFVSTKDFPPPSHLKITAVTRCRKSAADVQETGRRLAEFAQSVGLPFSFAQCRLDRDGGFRPAAIKVSRAEAVVFNCAIHSQHQLHHAAASVRSFLAGAAEIGARLVTLVEEDGRSADDGDVVGWFMRELQRYSAMWDAMDASFQVRGRAMEMVERVIFAPRIAEIVERALRRTEEDFAAAGWSEWMAAAGFRRVGLSFFNQMQAKLLLGVFNDGYEIDDEEPNKLVLRWKLCGLVAVSVWSARPSQPSPPAE
ncbi:Nodulation-signaling pathway 2 protein [Apostasia shenzhenica]|uniref:Nodulation-signaling pathway 2 protein n=1 Tax=Apostasia shenzhenica TaxID=1088818 RepID=A0A2I0AVF5_9ASPA|nr:Nodulation-signaling pathway 2 protein [Apostasia shenzhenica]